MLLFSLELTKQDLVNRTGLSSEEIDGYIGALSNIYNLYADRSLEWVAHFLTAGNMAEGLSLLNAVVILDGVPNSVFVGENINADNIRADVMRCGGEIIVIDIYRI